MFKYNLTHAIILKVYEILLMIEIGNILVKVGLLRIVLFERKINLILLLLHIMSNFLPNFIFEFVENVKLERDSL